MSTLLVIGVVSALWVTVCLLVIAACSAARVGDEELAERPGVDRRIADPALTEARVPSKVGLTRPRWH
jgi:hypothetical protein